MTDKRLSHIRSIQMAEPLAVDEEAGEVSGIIVPFGRPAPIVEPDEEGRLVRYREQFVPGSLAAQARYESRNSTPWSWLPLYHSHVESLSNHIGVAKDVHEREEGIWASFELLPDTSIEKVKALLRKSSRFFSVKFRELAEPVIEGDLISRTAVMVQHVAAVGVPAYAEAKIANVRDGEESAVSALLVEQPELDRVLAELADLEGPPADVSEPERPGLTSTLALLEELGAS